MTHPDTSLTPVYVAIGFVAAVMALLATLRWYSKDKLDLRTSDAAIALIPVALWMFLTGKVKELTVGDMKIVSALVDASNSPVDKQVTPLPVTEVRVDSKTAVFEIPKLLSHRTEALTFQMGHGSYYGPAIVEYLTRLSQSPSFRYVVINEADGRFLAMDDASRLAALLQAQGAAEAFASQLNHNDRGAILAMPGMVPLEKTESPSTDKKKALEDMQALDVQTLPVVDDAKHFIGIVDRSKLTASILIEVATAVGG